MSRRHPKIALAFSGLLLLALLFPSQSSGTTQRFPAPPHSPAKLELRAPESKPALPRLFVQRERAALAIGSRPGGADIFINSKDSGKTWKDGFRIWKVPPGAYTIALHKDGYEVFKYRNDLGPGERREIWPRLKPLPRAEAPRIIVPDVRNRLRAGAEGVLLRRRLRSLVLGYVETNNQGQHNRVARQSPGSNQRVDSGTTINLVLWRFAEVQPPVQQVLVPNVINQLVGIAQNALRNRGLRYRMAGAVETRDPALRNRVAAQNPRSDARVSRGTVVILTPYGFAQAPVSPIQAKWVGRASMPTPRWTPQAAAIRGLLYVTGGSDGRQDLSVLEAYNPATGAWRRLAPLPRVDSGNAGRYGGAVGVIDGRLYLAGGWRVRPPLPTRTLLIYDPRTNRWSRGADMPLLSGCSVSGVINRKLYVLTACDGYSGFRNRLHVYDPAANRWTERASAPNFHADGAAGVIGGKLYVAGGGVWGSPSASLDVYDPATNTWTTKASMPRARSGLAAGLIDGKLHVVGGVDARNNRLAALDIYDPVRNTWTPGPPMLTARSGLAAAVISRRLYAVGGHDGKRGLGTLEVFGPRAAPRVDLTGIWRANDGGTYYLRQLGKRLFWLGESADGGRSWTNVAMGTVSGNQVTLEWGDVSKGRNRNSGRLVLRIDNHRHLVRTQVTGGFGGSDWRR